MKVIKPKMVRVSVSKAGTKNLVRVTIKNRGTSRFV